MQTLSKQLVKEKVISITPHFSKTRKQKCNIYTYLGEDKEITPNSLTVKNIYDSKNKAGFRDWDWWRYKFIPGLFDEDFTKEMALGQYLNLLDDKNELKPFVKNLEKENKKANIVLNYKCSLNLCISIISL